MGELGGGQISRTSSPTSTISIFFAYLTYWPPIQVSYFFASPMFKKKDINGRPIKIKEKKKPILLSELREDIYIITTKDQGNKPWTYPFIII